MKHMLRYSALSAMATAFVATTSPAFAKPEHCPPGHAKKGWCAPAYDKHRRDKDHDKYRDRDHRDNGRDEARAYRQGYEEGRQDAIRYNGRTYTDYRMINDYGRYNLSAPPQGYGYAEVDGDVVMIQLATQIVTQLLNGR